MKEIKLTRGQIALVDDADFEWLNQWKWQAHRGKGKKTFYAGRTDRSNVGKEGVRMHRLIMGVIDPLIIVDHSDVNGLNNQRYNLRIATSVQSSMNRTKRVDNISGYKGVSFRQETKKWRVRIGIGGVVKTIGQFDNPLDAAIAYNNAAILIHGEFANLNDIKTSNNLAV